MTTRDNTTRPPRTHRPDGPPPDPAPFEVVGFSDAEGKSAPVSLWSGEDLPAAYYGTPSIGVTASMWALLGSDADRILREYARIELRRYSRDPDSEPEVLCAAVRGGMQARLVRPVDMPPSCPRCCGPVHGGSCQEFAAAAAKLLGGGQSGAPEPPTQQGDYLPPFEVEAMAGTWFLISRTRVPGHDWVGGRHVLFQYGDKGMMERIRDALNAEQRDSDNAIHRFSTLELAGVPVFIPPNTPVVTLVPDRAYELTQVGDHLLLAMFKRWPSAAVVAHVGEHARGLGLAPMRVEFERPLGETMTSGRVEKSDEQKDALEAAHAIAVLFPADAKRSQIFVNPSLPGPMRITFEKPRDGGQSGAPEPPTRQTGDTTA